MTSGKVLPLTVIDVSTPADLGEYLRIRRLKSSRIMMYEVAAGKFLLVSPTLTGMLYVMMNQLRGMNLGDDRHHVPTLSECLSSHSGEPVLKDMTTVVLRCLWQTRSYIGLFSSHSDVLLCNWVVQDIAQFLEIYWPKLQNLTGDIFYAMWSVDLEQTSKTTSLATRSHFLGWIDVSASSDPPNFMQNSGSNSDAVITPYGECILRSEATSSTQIFTHFPVLLPETEERAVGNRFDEGTQRF
ncbi:ER degradation-enhancing alpha-mannosidase-like protein 2 [Galemys pyrenaicus]|uniref:ER degradation-enhancing alpha-mannosidase-like protein 2 n=1 Tax=Galemys pyrenaicus TaxID=202257 RepID=A0A8J6AG70_GALPY|nr:ER degradation-enhancing alpha-mannosidase-like protein 2 [Galemys pyrenaicus]